MKEPQARQARLRWITFGASSFAAVLTGCVVLMMRGEAVRAWAPNLAAWTLGAAITAVIHWRRSTRRFPWPAVGLAVLASTFVFAGLSGVHRWIEVGPVRLNGGELVLAPFLVAAIGPHGGRSIGPALIVLAMILLALQPDASQAAGLAAGSVVAMALRGQTTPGTGVVGLLLTAIALVAVLRKDPLTPVPEVEGIIQLAAARSPTLAALAVATLAGAVLSPLSVVAETTGPVRAAAAGLAVYLATCALAPAFGAFPVPLVGMGVSPILGAWLGFAALMRLVRQGSAEERLGPLNA